MRFVPDTVVVRGGGTDLWYVSFSLAGKQWKVTMVVGTEKRTRMIDRSIRVGRTIALEMLNEWKKPKTTRRQSLKSEPTQLRVVG